MRAAQLTAYRQDFAIGEVPEPEITAPTDVIVRVGAAGFCRTDIHIWDGQFDEAWKAAGIGLPFVPGHETAGWVHEVGSAVNHIAVGDAVLHRDHRGRPEPGGAGARRSRRSPAAGPRSWSTSSVRAAPSATPS